MAPPEPIPTNRWRALAARALEWSLPEWPHLCVQKENNHSKEEEEEDKEPTSNNIEESEIVESLVALLWIRLVALQSPVGTFEDLSTSAICQGILASECDTINDNAIPIPEALTTTVLEQLVTLVRRLLPGGGSDGNSNDDNTVDNKNETTRAANASLPYHSPRHVLQVVVNANKLIELMLHRNNSSTTRDCNASGSRTAASIVQQQQQQQLQAYSTFGLALDPLAWTGLLLAGLAIHTDDNGGALNKQLVASGHLWALQYNDTNVQQQRSLHVAFATLRTLPALTTALCTGPWTNNTPTSTPPSAATFAHTQQDDNYRYLRQLMVTLVLGTDMECPLRAEIFYSKWKESFGQQQHHHRHLHATNNNNFHNNNIGNSGNNHNLNHCPSRPSSALRSSTNRRSSLTSNISMPRAVQTNRFTERRSSISSVVSDVTIDTEWDSNYSYGNNNANANANNSNAYQQQQQQQQQQARQQQQRQQVYEHNARFKRRQSNQSETWSYYSDYANDSVALQQQHNMNMRMAAAANANKGSNNKLRSDSGDSELRGSISAGPDDQDARRNDEDDDDEPLGPRIRHRAESTHTRESEISFPSIAADSIGLAHQKQQQQQYHHNPTQNNIPNNQQQRRMYPPAIDNVETSPISLRNAKQPTRRASVDMGGAVGPDDSRHRSHTDDDNDDDYGSEDDGSFTLTPPSSDDEMDGVVITGVTLSRSMEEAAAASAAPQRGVVAHKSSEDILLQYHHQRNNNNNNNNNNMSSRPSPLGNGSNNSSSYYYPQPPPQQVPPIARSSPRRMSRRASTGNRAIHFQGPSLQGFRIDEEGGVVDPQQRQQQQQEQQQQQQQQQSEQLEFQQQPSPDAGLLSPANHFRRPDVVRSTSFKRLSIRRSMDFSGESLENFSRKSLMSSDALGESLNGTQASDLPVGLDPSDNLKAAVVLELFLRASCVGHYMQSWDNLVDWTECWYRECSEVHKQGRGPHPAATWFDAQLKIMEQYVLPLATKLRDAGVLPDETGLLADGVELNRDQWLVDGFDVTLSFQNAHN